MKLAQINKRIRELELTARQGNLTKTEEEEYNKLWNEKDKKQGVADFRQKLGKVF